MAQVVRAFYIVKYSLPVSMVHGSNPDGGYFFAPDFITHFDISSLQEHQKLDFVTIWLHKIKIWKWKFI